MRSVQAALHVEVPSARTPSTVAASEENLRNPPEEQVDK